jgi:uncharacterized protein (DUF2461 family)
MTKFEGFTPGVRTWFEGLQADNSREYFAANRDFFELSIRGQMEALLGELAERFGGQVKVFRQNRDVRFSPDKSPYRPTRTASSTGPSSPSRACTRRSPRTVLSLAAATT